ncbi:MAG: rhodanese-like domain-containing protein [Aerococcaceae bacterium]|nr:rhodanese-like domain-containing protein [Aerococcaceae bacterium]
MYQNISMQDFQKKATTESLNIIDVRTVEQFEAGHVPSAMSVPLDELEQSIDQLDKEKEYYVMCQLGIKSQKASELLAAKGYKVVNVDGGAKDWVGELEK